MLVNKPLGMTPLQAIRVLKEKRPQYAPCKIGYAGRLDPMADGLLLLLLNEENKKKETYQLLSKEYRIEIVFGLTTDTGDVLGKITSVHAQHMDYPIDETFITRYIGKHLQEYPAYSSVRVQGKPLFYWARANQLASIEIPKKEITIDALYVEAQKQCSMKEMTSLALSRIALVTGDFRQESIQQSWVQSEKQYPNAVFLCVTVRVGCSSGTYMRWFAQMLGQKAKTGAIVTAITRLQIGEYSLSHAIQL